MEPLLFRPDPVDNNAVWQLLPDQRIGFHRRYINLAIFSLILVAITATLGTVNFSSDLTAITSFWPAAAFQIVLPIWFGIYGVLACVIGPMIGNVIFGETAFLFIPANIIQSVMAGLWFRFRKLDPRLRSRRDWLGALLIGCVLANVLGALIGVGESTLRGIPENYPYVTGRPIEEVQLSSLANWVYQNYPNNIALVFWAEKLPMWFLGNCLPCLILVPALLKTASPIIIRGPFFCQSFWGGSIGSMKSMHLMRFNDIPIVAKLILLAEVAGIIPLTLVAIWSILDTMRTAEMMAQQANQGITRLIRDEIDRHELLLRNWTAKLDHPEITIQDQDNMVRQWARIPFAFGDLKFADRKKTEARVSEPLLQNYRDYPVIFLPEYLPNQTPSEGIRAVARLQSRPNQVLTGICQWRLDNPMIQKFAVGGHLIVQDRRKNIVFRKTPPELDLWQIPDWQHTVTDDPVQVAPLYKIDVDNKLWNVSEAYIERLGWRFIRITSAKKGRAVVLANIPRSVALLINLAIFGSLIASCAMAGRITERVLTIAEHVHETEADPDKILNIPIRGRDELGYLGHTLNRISRDLAENVRKLRETTAEKERLATEMDLARQVQMSILPEAAPEIPGYQCSGASHPAREVGGDFYDLFLTDSQRLLMMIGDAVGKGLRAAMFITETHGIAHAAALHQMTPESILTLVNKTFISARGPSGDFVTMFCAALDHRQHQFTYASAGHNPPLLVRDGSVQNLRIGNCPLAVESGIEYCLEAETLQSGDMIVMYTDGITEAFNKQNQMFGDERLKNLVCEYAQNSPSDLTRVIIDEVRNFAVGVPQSDDMTLLIIQRKT
jgi:serine phosphatase RsbU (regulator of sigma subunit)